MMSAPNAPCARACLHSSVCCQRSGHNGVPALPMESAWTAWPSRCQDSGLETGRGFRSQTRWLVCFAADTRCDPPDKAQGFCMVSGTFLALFTMNQAGMLMKYRGASCSVDTNYQGWALIICHRWRTRRITRHSPLFTGRNLYKKGLYFDRKRQTARLFDAYAAYKIK